MGVRLMYFTISETVQWTLYSVSSFLSFKQWQAIDGAPINQAVLKLKIQNFLSETSMKLNYEAQDDTISEILDCAEK